MLRRLVMAALAMVAAAVVTSADAQRASGDRWVLLGTQQIDLRKETDSIDVSAARGAYKALRLEVKDGDVLMSRVRVFYDDGRVHNEERRINLLRGDRTRPIDLQREHRFVDRLTFDYQRDRGERRVTVEVWGLQGDRGERAVRRVGGGGSVAVGGKGNAPSGNITGPSTGGGATTAKPGDLTASGVLFGVQGVGFGVDRDVIRVGNEVGKFDRLRMRVLDNDIHINEIKVIYNNGEPDLLAVDADIPKNSFTKWLSLKGDRFIKEIQLSYRSRPSFKGQATVEVYGEYAQGWLGPQGEGRKYNQGWVLLGAQTAGFVGFDKDTIPVGRNEGGFKKIRVTVRDRAITLNEIRVIYGNGQEDIVPVRTRVDAGSTYGPIDLKGNSRIIDRIEARYRSRVIDASARGKGSAIVEFWGQH